MALRGARADHRDDALLLAVHKQGSGSGSLFLVDGTIQSAVHMSMPHLPNRLRCQGYEPGDTAERSLLLPTTEARGTQSGAHRLNTPVQELLQYLPILF
jgi:hypothetical protein